METQIRVILVDDKEKYRIAIKDLLFASGIEVVAEAAHGKELLELKKLKNREFDIVLLDLDMPIMDGAETVGYFFKFMPDVKIIILSLHDQEDVAQHLFLQGVKGYVPKDEVVGSSNTLVTALQKVHAGGVFDYKTWDGRTISFSIRQKEIIYFFCKGSTNKEIAEILRLTEGAIEKQKQNMMESTNTKNGTEFLKYCLQRGLHLFNPIRS